MDLFSVTPTVIQPDENQAAWLIQAICTDNVGEVRKALGEQVKTDMFGRIVTIIKPMDINYKDHHNNGRHLLHYACEAHTYSQVLDILIKHPKLNPNATDDDGQTPLHLACDAGRIDRVSCLLSHKDTNPNAVAADGMTPILRAAMGKHISTVVFLFAVVEEIDTSKKAWFTPDSSKEPREVCLDDIIAELGGTLQVMYNDYKESPIKVRSMLWAKYPDLRKYMKRPDSRDKSLVIHHPVSKPRMQHDKPTSRPKSPLGHETPIGEEVAIDMEDAAVAPMEHTQATGENKVALSADGIPGPTHSLGYQLFLSLSLCFRGMGSGGSGSLSNV